jgi:hemolysin III
MNARPAVRVTARESALPSFVEREMEEELAPSSQSRVREASRQVERAKPLLRGVSHQVAFFVAIFATAFLYARAAAGGPKTATLAFGACLVFLFGTSALYHRVDWTPEARQRMRRLDHAAIFVLIAGGYTPLFSLVAKPGGGHGALTFIWLGASLGIAKSLAWPHAPKWITALLCVVLGWTVIFEVAARASIVGALATWMLVASGVVYSLGAIVYATKRPDPFPRTFGYHEVFHAIVIGASACLFTHVALVVLRPA